MQSSCEQARAVMEIKTKGATKCHQELPITSLTEAQFTASGSAKALSLTSITIVAVINPDLPVRRAKAYSCILASEGAFPATRAVAIAKHLQHFLIPCNHRCLRADNHNTSELDPSTAKGGEVLEESLDSSSLTSPRSQISQSLTTQAWISSRPAARSCVKTCS